MKQNILLHGFSLFYIVFQVVSQADFNVEQTKPNLKFVLHIFACIYKLSVCNFKLCVCHKTCRCVEQTRSLQNKLIPPWLSLFYKVKFVLQFRFCSRTFLTYHFFSRTNQPLQNKLLDLDNRTNLTFKIEQTICYRICGPGCIFLKSYLIIRTAKKV